MCNEITDVEIKYHESKQRIHGTDEPICLPQSVKLVLRWLQKNGFHIYGVRVSTSDKGDP